MRWVGRPLPRYEDPVLLRGRGRYTADLARGARVLRFVRSPVSRGRILTVKAPPEVPIITAAVLGDVNRSVHDSIVRIMSPWRSRFSPMSASTMLASRSPR